MHEFYLLTDDVRAFVARMRKHKIAFGRVRDQGYGLFATITMPGGGHLDVYEPRHARPKAMRAKTV